MRSNVSKANYFTIRKYATYPNNKTFDESLSELIREFKKLKKGDS